MSNPPQGWYPDPNQNDRLRWWNGTVWTSDYAPLPAGQSGATQTPGATQTSSGTRQATQPAATKKTGIAARLSGAVASLKTLAEAYKVRPGETKAERNKRFNKEMLRRWKLLAVLSTLLLVTMCSVAVGSAEPEDTQRRDLTATESQTPTPTPTPSPSATPSPTEEPTVTPSERRRARWERREEKNAAVYAAALAAALNGKGPSDSTNEAISTCDDIRMGMSLKQRVSRAQTRFAAGSYSPTKAQARKAIDATVQHVCTDQRAKHRKQVKAAAPKPKPTPTPKPTPAPPPPTQQSNCASGYSPCIPNYPPDLNCSDVNGPITVRGSDPHGLDADGDGVACES